METEHGKISGEILRKVYFADTNSATKLFSNLTDNHFQYDTFDKMKVCLAVQILSESVAKGLEHVLSAGYFKPESQKKIVQSTVTFVRNMNTLFDLMNAKSANDPNENKRGVSIQNINRLTELSDYISSIKQTESAVYWIDGLNQTVRGIIGMFNEEYRRDPEFVLMSRFLNQDPLENLFGQIRAQGKTNRNPFLIDFLRTMSRIITSNTLIATSKTNCEVDDSTKVKVFDFETFELPEEDTKPIKPVYLTSF